MAYAHLQLKHYDSVLYYQQKYRQNLDSVTLDTLVRNRFKPLLWGFSIEVELAQKQYEKILADILPNLKKLREAKDIIPLM